MRNRIKNVYTNRNTNKNLNSNINKNFGQLFTGLLRHNKGMTAGLLVAMAGSIVAGLLPPLILEQIVNKITAMSGISISLILFYFGMLAFAGIFNAAKEVKITQFGQRMTRQIRKEMCGKLNSLPASYFTSHPTGEVVSAFINDVDTVQSLFSNGVISMVVNLVQIISILAIIFVKSKGLGVMMLIVAPLIYLMTRHFQKRILEAQQKNRAAIAKVSNHIPETIHNLRTIQNLMKQKFMEQKYDEDIMASYAAMEQSNLYDSIYSPIILTISAVIVGGMMSLASMGGGFQAAFGMTTGTAVAIIAYVGKIFDPIESLGMEIQNIQEAMAGIRRITAFMNEPEKKETEEIKETNEIKETKGKKETNEIKETNYLPNQQSEDCVTFTNVDFAYDSGTHQEKILNQLSFTISSGENVILAGRTGCGKSTVMKLILGLYSPDSGQVLIHQTPADQIMDSRKRKLFGYVEQTFHRVNGTIADQITLKDPQFTKDQIESAARMVGLHDVILGLKDGYDTICNDKILSQGQFQLLSIARAIISNPGILLLDEITANLDTATEEKILKAIAEAGRNRTVISISHRVKEENAMDQNDRFHILRA